MGTDWLVVVARLVMAVVFGVAGLAKLTDLAGTREMLVGASVRPGLARPLAIGLPVAELAIAAALLTANSAWAASLAALALLALFSVVLGVNLRRGRRPDCRCFGQLGSAPVGPDTFARNAILAGVAGAVAWQGPRATAASAVEGIADLGPAALVGGALVIGVLAMVVWLVLNVIRQNGRLLLRIEKLEESLWRGAVLAAPSAGLPVGAVAPSFQLQDPSGTQRSLDELRADGKSVLLIFSDPTCGPCNELLPEIGRWQHDHGGLVTIALITGGTVTGQRPKAERRLNNVLIEESGEVQRAYRAQLMSAVVVGSDGIVCSPLGVGLQAIERLLERTLDGSLLALRIEGHPHGPGLHLPNPPRPGAPAPALRLTGRDGQMVDLWDLRGQRTLLLFWNPNCPLCGHLLTDVQVWESNGAMGQTQLVVIAADDGVVDPTVDLRSTMVRDEGSVAAQAFGVFGTPCALLVDDRGHVSSEMAVGTAAVRALLKDS